MGSGDLNLKKAWHPNTLKNQEIVWKREEAVEKEKLKLIQLKKELQEERDREELARLHAQGRNKKKKDRLEWMYSAGPAQGQDFIDQEKEDYLLGRKRIEKVTEEVSYVATAGQDSIYGSLANTQRDFAAKVREDPLLVFRKQEQEAMEAMIANPVRMKEIQKVKKKSSKVSSSRSSARSPSRISSIRTSARSPVRSRERSPVRYRSRSRERSYRSREKGIY